MKVKLNYILNEYLFNNNKTKKFKTKYIYIYIRYYVGASKKNTYSCWASN